MFAGGVVAVTYYVRAVRAGKYWELHIEGEGVTQTRSLKKAEAMVRDWLATEYDRDFSGAEIVVAPDLGGYEAAITAARSAVKEAALAQREAANRQRIVAANLKKRGLTGDDIGKLMGISKSRVTHLTTNKKLINA